jgi:hypothetical protein
MQMYRFQAGSQHLGAIYPSVRLWAWKNLRPTDRILIKFDTGTI